MDELVLTSPAETVNEERQADAERRVWSAVLTLQEMCEMVTVNEVARLTKAHKQTVARALRTRVHTLNRDLSNGMNRVTQTNQKDFRKPTALGARLVPDGLCKGGCGKPMPPGQMCFACAQRDLEVWRESRKHRGHNDYNPCYPARSRRTSIH